MTREVVHQARDEGNLELCNGSGRGWALEGAYILLGPAACQ